MEGVCGTCITPRQRLAALAVLPVPLLPAFAAGSFLLYLCLMQGQVFFVHRRGRVRVFRMFHVVIKKILSCSLFVGVVCIVHFSEMTRVSRGRGIYGGDIKTSIKITFTSRKYFLNIDFDWLDRFFEQHTNSIFFLLPAVYVSHARQYLWDFYLVVKSPRDGGCEDFYVFYLRYGTEFGCHVPVSVCVDVLRSFSCLSFLRYTANTHRALVGCFSFFWFGDSRWRHLFRSA